MKPVIKQYYILRAADQNKKREKNVSIAIHIKIKLILARHRFRKFTTHPRHTTNKNKIWENKIKWKRKKWNALNDK